MKFEAISKRLDALDTPGRCPHCEALEAMSEAELDTRLRAFASGQEVDDLPEPSPKCPRCQAENQRLGAMSEEELDARLAELQDILRDAIGNESG